MSNKNLHNAKTNVDDEFYTQYEDIETECIKYKDFYKNKIIYCNCDNASWSNFFKYFFNNFEKFELKGLKATCYGSANSELSMFSLDEELEDLTTPYYINITPELYKDINMSGDDFQKCLQTEVETHNLNYLKVLEGDGDFNSKECRKILLESDVVVTNPPFSLFRDLIALLESSHKEYLILGSNSAITYKNVFKLFRNGTLQLGYTAPTKFRQPDDTYRTVTTRWYTNFKFEKDMPYLELTNKYDVDKYHYYDNFNALEVSNISEIPTDFDGIMGVPVSFMDVYNKHQFELIGHEHDIDGKGTNVVHGQFEVNGTGVFKRILIKHKH